MADTHHNKRAIPLDTDGIARLINEFNSHLEVQPPVALDFQAPRKPSPWEDEDLKSIRESVRHSDTGIVDIEAHIRALVLYTEIPDDVIRNISILALVRIGQKLLHAQGSLAFRHGTYLRVETDRAKMVEILGEEPKGDRIVVNVWTPSSDLSQPPRRRVPVPVLDEAARE